MFSTSLGEREGETPNGCKEGIIGLAYLPFLPHETYYAGVRRSVVVSPHQHQHVTTLHISTYRWLVGPGSRDLLSPSLSHCHPAWSGHHFLRLVTSWCICRCMSLKPLFPVRKSRPGNAPSGGPSGLKTGFPKMHNLDAGVGSSPRVCSRAGSDLRCTSFLSPLCSRFHGVAFVIYPILPFLPLLVS